MLDSARHWLRYHVRLYDLTVRLRRAAGAKSSTYDVMDEFSKAHLGCVRFVQIGASNGLNSDPIREFIVRDQWSGLLVEPLPASFARLTSNYERLGDRDLVFVNAAIVAADQPPGSYWAFSNSFLSELSAEQRISYAQKSSFNLDHVAGFLHERSASDRPVVEIPVRHLTLPELMSCYARSPEVDLLVTDCEGYEATLLPSIDWQLFRPTAVLFESHNLGSHEEEAVKPWHAMGTSYSALAATRSV